MFLVLCASRYPKTVPIANCTAPSGCFFMDGFVIAGLVVIAICAVLAVHLRDILRAAIALAVLSVVLAAIFFKLGAPYAGAFELSVCAGLITVLFIAAISSVEARRE